MEFLLTRADWSYDPEIRAREVAKEHKELKGWTIRAGKLTRYVRTWKEIVTLPVLFVSLDNLHDLLALTKTIGHPVILSETKEGWALQVYDDYIE